MRAPAAWLSLGELPATVCIWASACLVASGCAAEAVEPPALAPIPLLDPAALTPVDAAHDPLLAHRPAEVDCPPATWGAEGGGFEVQTGACNYAAFDQPLPTPLRAGDALSLVVWHDLLDAETPGTAHLAVWIGRTVVWETEVAIPAPSDSFEVVVPIDTTPAPDARLGFHLHNHGFNSWRLLAADLVR